MYVEVAEYSLCVSLFSLTELLPDLGVHYSSGAIAIMSWDGGSSGSTQSYCCWRASECYSYSGSIVFLHHLPTMQLPHIFIHRLSHDSPTSCPMFHAPAAPCFTQQLPHVSYTSCPMFIYTPAASCFAHMGQLVCETWDSRINI